LIGQAVQVDEKFIPDPVEYVPGEHRVQRVSPLLKENEPDGHNVQLFLNIALTRVENVPAVQKVQVVFPVSISYVPGVQFKHDCCLKMPDDVLNVPAEQLEQLNTDMNPMPDPYVPAVH